jgi:hypothetical protein
MVDREWGIVETVYNFKNRPILVDFLVPNLYQ